MRVAGLDPSMTAAGIAIHEPGGLTFVTEVGEKGKRDDSLGKRRERQARTTASAMDYLRSCDYVAVEGHSFTTRSAMQHDLSGQWWDIVGELIDHGIPVVEIELHRLKGYLTSNGNASKMQMLADAIRRYPEVDIRTDNQADAITACSMLVRALELTPLERAWNQRMGLEMSKVNWDAIHGRP